jgi:hypothetical protein
VKSSMIRRGFAVLRSDSAVPIVVVVGRLWPATSTFRIADHSRPTGEVTRTSCPQRGPPPTLRELGRTATTTRPRLRRYSSRRGRGTQLAENRRQIHWTTCHATARDGGRLRLVARAVAVFVHRHRLLLGRPNSRPHTGREATAVIGVEPTALASNVDGDRWLEVVLPGLPQSVRVRGR